MIIILDANIVFSAILNRESILWTGDKALIKGIKLTGYDKVITTTEMVKLRNRLG